ncbi:hypothetical protein [Streptomyces sp. NPDC056987]
MRFVVFTGPVDGFGGAMKGAAEEIDGVALEAESHTGVDTDGDTDVGVTE